MTAHLLNVKRRSARAMFAIAFMSFCGMGRLAGSADKTVLSPNLPDFAKKVHVNVAGKTISLDEAIRKATTDEANIFFSHV